MFPAIVCTYLTMYVQKITKIPFFFFFVFLYQSLSFFIHVQQNLPSCYVEENQPILNQSHHGMYLSAIIYILGGLELKFIGKSRTDRIRY